MGVSSKDIMDKVVADIRDYLECTMEISNASLGGEAIVAPITSMAVNVAHLVRDMTTRNLLNKEEDTKRKPGVVYFTELGKPCVREVWYKANYPVLKEATPYHTLIKFSYGNIVEEMVLCLAELAGHQVLHKQEKITHKINGDITVSGRIDAVIDGVLVDVKGTTAYGFEKFKNHRALENDTFGYGHQLNGYRIANINENVFSTIDPHQASFLAVHRDLGHVVADTYASTELPFLTYKDFAEAATRFAPAFDTSKKPDRMPNAEVKVGTSGNMGLCTYCSYCSFKRECWEGELKTYIYSDGPKFLTKVVREPKVKEVVK